MQGVILLDEMARPAARAPLLLFGLVAAYIVLQSVWWAWLLISKDADLMAVQQQLIAEGVTPRLPIRTPEHTLSMVAGEGGVFLLLLLVALWLTFRTVRHELALARQQRDFLLAASHELRTPIAGLKLHLQTLQRPGLHDDQREGLTATARSEVERLQALTEKILLATRLQEAHMPLELQRVDVVPVLRDLCASARISYGRGHHIREALPADALLTIDLEAFRSIAGNLLENACKYAPEGTTVEVSLTALGDRSELVIADEGRGVPEAERDRIFTKFFRGGQEETRGTKGTGLGLYIVDRLMRAHGGRVEYRPRAPQGSIFAVLFPQR